MTTNYHTPWIDGTTEYKASDMNAPLSELDSAIDKARGPKYYDHIGQYLGDKPNSNGLIMRAVVSRYMVLEAGALKSELYVGTTPTDGPATFTIRRNGSNVGSVLVNPGHNWGAFTVSTDVQFYHSDLLELLAPNPQDASMQDISWNIVLMRPDTDYMTTTTTTTETTTTTTTTV